MARDSREDERQQAESTEKRGFELDWLMKANDAHREAVSATFDQISLDPNSVPVGVLGRPPVVVATDQLRSITGFVLA